MPNSSLVPFCSQQSSCSMDEPIFSTGLKQISLCFYPEVTQGSIFFPITEFKQLHITEQTYFMTFLKLPGKLQLYFCNQAHNFFCLFMITGITTDEKFGAEHTHLQPPELKKLLTFYTTLACFYNICLKGTSSKYTTLTDIYLCSSTSFT